MAGSKTIATSDTRIESLQLQSSAYGVAIPIVGGVTRIAGNLIDYDDFKAIANTKSQGGKGGSVKTTQTTYTYVASLIMGLCHGQVTDVPRVWKGKTLYGNGAAGTLLAATETYAVPGGGGSYTVVQAAAYGSPQSVHCLIPDEFGSTNWPVRLAEGEDFVQSAGVYSFPAGSRAAGRTATIRYTYASVAPGTPALGQIGATLLPGHATQAAPSWVATLHPAKALSYAGLACISAQGYSLGPGAQVENHNFEVVGPGAYGIGPAVPDIDPAAFVVRVLQDARYGARMPAQYIGDHALWSTYCLANNLLVSPAITAQMSAAELLKTAAAITNTGPVWSGGRLRFVPYGDASATAHGATYTPDTTPVYALSDDVFIVDGGAPPVRVTRKPSSKAHNHVRVQFRNRANSYALEVAEAKDQADIDINGLRSADIFNAEWVCDAGIARNVAQLQLQRSLYVRAEYAFTLPLNFDFLEPMDLVTVHDPAQGLVQHAVRITEVGESGGDLAFTAEHFALGVASAALYGTQVGAGFSHDYNAAPGSVQPPVIFEAPAALTTTGLEVYVAAVGTGAHWGGCNVWVSLDGSNYRLASTINGGSRYGELDGAAGSSGGMAVEILAGELASGSAADATALTLLCWAGGASPEYFAYEIANLTSALHYSLSGTVARGAYGSPAAAHSNGDPFVRVDDSVGKSGPLELSYVGKTLHIKLTSFNEYGGAEESLAAVTDYTYTITGRMAALGGARDGNLVDPTWWRPGAAWEWALNENPAGENSIIWGTGPKGAPQALWRCVAAGTPGVDADGGWQQGLLSTTPKNAFTVDPRSTYRFAVPVLLASGSGSAHFGPATAGVCDLNTGTANANPYFWVGTPPALNRWYLMVGYVFPAGSTGLTNAGAGLYDMETGALVSAGTNYCWAAAAQEGSTRAYLFYATTGATQYFSHPVVERFNGADVGKITYIGGSQVNTPNVASYAITNGAVVDSATGTGSSGSPGASTRVATLWGPTLTTVAGDELDIVVSGVLEDTFWSQAAVAAVELWLTHAPTFGGTQTEFGTRKKFFSPVDEYTNPTRFALDMTGQLVPGAVTQDYVLRVSIAYKDAAGAAKTCGKDFTADAQWRVVKRKR